MSATLSRESDRLYCFVSDAAVAASAAASMIKNATAVFHTSCPLRRRRVEFRLCAGNNFESEFFRFRDKDSGYQAISIHSIYNNFPYFISSVVWHIANIFHSYNTHLSHGPHSGFDSLDFQHRTFSIIFFFHSIKSDFKLTILLRSRKRSNFFSKTVTNLISPTSESLGCHTNFERGDVRLYGKIFREIQMKMHINGSVAKCMPCI